ncbi:hypothetical protein BBJ28_00013081 [Nothophytophthora sp. Chile5]|nr:hypothetical protein BBJ28_00013081 [Nothophytophthora sp. Chile5]
MARAQLFRERASQAADEADFRAASANLFQRDEERWARPDQVVLPPQRHDADDDEPDCMSPQYNLCMRAEGPEGILKHTNFSPEAFERIWDRVQDGVALWKLGHAFKIVPSTFQKMVCKFLGVLSPFLYETYVECADDSWSMGKLVRSGDTFQMFGSMNEIMRYCSGKHHLYGLYPFTVTVKPVRGRIESKRKFKFADDQPGTEMEEGESYSKADVELALARLENDLAEWVAAMQRCGVPVGRKEIIAKASAMLVVATACPFPTRNTPTRVLTGGWYRQRHPSLSSRIAQCIARVRNSVDGEGVSTLFYTLSKLFIEMNIDSVRVFNMDETSFMTKTARRKVVAVRGSANVVYPPLLIVSGVRLSKEDIAALSIKGSAITGAPKGFSNKTIFVQWLKFFGENIADLKKPVVLIVDNSSTHIGTGKHSSNFPFKYVI